MHHNADIAVAVAIDGGLITPIVRAAETKSLAVIATEMKDLAARARDRKLKPAGIPGRHLLDLEPRHVRHQVLRLDHQRAAGRHPVGRRRREAARRGRRRAAVATVMSVTLTCDHRVIDGVIGSNFLIRPSRP